MFYKYFSKCICDADLASCPNDHKSTFGVYVFLSANPITWSTKKQSVVSRSSVEAKYEVLP